MLGLGDASSLLRQDESDDVVAAEAVRRAAERYQDERDENLATLIAMKVAEIFS